MSRQEPSRWRDRLVLAALAVVGLAISIYLAIYQLGGIASPWDPAFGPSSSARVLHSVIARMLPVPDAALGSAAYTAEIVLGLAGGTDRWRTHPWLVVAFAVVAAALGLAGVALTVVQLAVVRSGCTLCLCSAAASVTIALAAAAGEELRAALHVISPALMARKDV